MESEQLYNTFEDSSGEITKMAEADQAMRQRWQEGNFDAEEYQNIDVANTARMKEIVDQLGWPSKSIVGEESAHNAWLLVQHADHDVPFQKRCLELMKNTAVGEVNPQDIAFLEDRIRVKEGLLQLYGTQFDQDPKSGLYAPSPMEDPQNINARRASIGLEPLEEYAKNWEK